MKRWPFFVKTAVAAALAAGLAAGGFLIAVKVLFPEARARAWLIEAASRQLGREVRLERIDVGLRGLSLRGLEVSERGGFAAGTFLRVEDFRLLPSWRALLKRRLVVDAVSADGLEIRVVKGADGRFNYETLASAPAAAAPEPRLGRTPAPAPAPEMDVRRVRITRGTVAYSDADGAAWTLSDLNVDMPHFAPFEPLGVSSAFRIQGAAGSVPVDASASFDGSVDLGRGGRDGIKATLSRLTVEQRGLTLAASGTLALSDAAADAHLAGTFAGGRLQLDATAKNEGPGREIQVEASLDRLDLGRVLAAEIKTAAKPRASPSAGPAKSSERSKPAAGGKPTLVGTRGHLKIGTLVHPNATVADVKVDWELRGLGGDERGLNGDAKLSVGAGRVRSAGELAGQSKFVEILLFPLLIVQKLGAVGGVSLFPNFNDVKLERIFGDYGFRDGIMTLRASRMDSDAARVSAKGTIDLPKQALDLVVTANVGRMAPIDVAVTGTFAQPKTKVDLGKLLGKPADQLIRGLLHIK